MGFKKNAHFILHLAKITSIFFSFKLVWNITQSIWLKVSEEFTKYSAFNRLRFLSAIFVAEDFYSYSIYPKCQLQIFIMMVKR